MWKQQQQPVTRSPAAADLRNTDPHICGAAAAAPAGKKDQNVTLVKTSYEADMK